VTSEIRTRDGSGIRLASAEEASENARPTDVTSGGLRHQDQSETAGAPLFVHRCLTFVYHAFLISPLETTYMGVDRVGLIVHEQFALVLAIIPIDGVPTA
jgi:hypothetical protein